MARVVRLTADTANLNRAVANSLVVLLGAGGAYAQIGNPDEMAAAPLSCQNRDGSAVTDCIPVEGTAHQTNALQFGPDGALYVAVGDGGEHPKAGLRAQDANSLSGKILRIDPLTGAGYATNPFYDGSLKSNRAKVYALGLRNPFRFVVAPGGNELYIGDVGNARWEEVNRGGAGANFGWPCFEGEDGASAEPPCAAVTAKRAALTFPIYAYPHTEGRVAVVGGDFYRGTTFPEQYRSSYFFADYNAGTIWQLKPGGQAGAVEPFARGISGVVQITSGPDGAFYVLTVRGGTLLRIRYGG